MQDRLEKLWSVEAEAAVLGSMIIDSDCIANVLPILPTEDAFYKEEHRLIYTALLRLYTKKQPIDAIALRTGLKATNELDAAGGVEYIAKILESVPSSANALYYAGVVRDRQRYRDLITTAEQIRAVPDEPLGVDEAIQKIQDIALAMETGKTDTEFFTLADHAAKVAEAIKENQETVLTGFRNIDRLIQGIAPGEVCIIAGRPSMGKSALALGIALNIAKAGKSVLFFTLEMTHQALIQRAIISTGKVTVSRMSEGLTDYEFGRAKESAAELERLNLVLHEGGTTPEKQIAFIRTRKKLHKVDVVFVDYLQLMNAGRKTENRVQEISTISRKLKLAAIQEQVPIIALSQLNRQVEARVNHRPKLSDLRESGALEQDADIVLLLHREDYYRRSEKPDTTDVDGNAELIVAKNRRGPTGIAELKFLEESVTFGDLSYDS